MVSGSMNLGITVSADCSSCIGGNCVDVWTAAGFVGIGADRVADCVDGVGGVVGTDRVADCIDGGVGGVVLGTGGDVVTDAIVEC